MNILYEKNKRNFGSFSLSLMWSTDGVLIKLVVQVRAFAANFISMIEPLMNPVWVLLFIGEVPSLPAIFGGILILAA